MRLRSGSASGLLLLISAGGLGGPVLVSAQPTTTSVSVGPAGVLGNDFSGPGAISADGRWVAFESPATNLVSADTNGAYDVFVHDRQTGATTRASLASGGIQRDCSSRSAAISADGRWVAFVSTERNLAGVCDSELGILDVFLHDRPTGSTTRVSEGPGGVRANGRSGAPVLSADGRLVAFKSAASNLVEGDTNGVDDVFVYDQRTGTITRVSLGPQGTQANSWSWPEALSADGRWVGFSSRASNLVVGDTNGAYDVFVHDRLTATTTRVSVGIGGAEANGASFGAAMSADGRWVAFASDARNLVASDTNGVQDVFVHDRHTGATTRVSATPAGTERECPSSNGAVNAFGRFVTFTAQARNAAGVCDVFGINEVFWHDRLSGATEPISVGLGGAQPNGPSGYATLSADGRHVAFMSRASNLAAGDTNGREDVFVRDRGDMGCPITLARLSATAPAAGGTDSLLVLSPAACAWTATANDPGWLTVTGGASGIGLGRVDFGMAANAGSTRSSTIAVGGQIFTVHQFDAMTPMAPAGLVAHSVAGSTVTLRWALAPDGPSPTGFVVEGGIGPGEVLASIPTGSAVPTFTFTAPTGSFYARVHALNGTFRSAASNEIRLHVNVPVAPSAPAHLLAVVNGSNVALAWTNTFGGAAPTSLALDVNGVLVGTIPLGLGDHVSFVNVPGGAYIGNIYWVALRAQNAAGSSQPTSTLTLRVPEPCSGAPAMPIGVLPYRVGRTVSVDWAPGPSGSAPTVYIVNVSGSMANSFVTTGRVLSGVVSPGSYTLSVMAANPCGASAATSPQTVVVP